MDKADQLQQRADDARQVAEDLELLLGLRLSLELADSPNSTTASQAILDAISAIERAEEELREELESI